MHPSIRSIDFKKKIHQEQTIGQLAQAVGVNPQTIRFYERKGLLPPPLRQGSGNYRAYGEADRERLEFILRAKAAGFTLKDIGKLTSTVESDVACQEVAELVAARLQDVQAKLKELNQLRRELDAMWRKCMETPDNEPCPVIESFNPGK